MRGRDGGREEERKERGREREGGRERRKGEREGGRDREKERRGEGGREREEKEGGKERMRMFIHLHCQVFFAPLKYLPHVPVNTIGF